MRKNIKDEHDLKKLEKEIEKKIGKAKESG